MSYKQKLVEMVASGFLAVRPGTLNELIIRHDDNCPRLRSRHQRCRCDPEFELVEIADWCGRLQSSVPEAATKRHI